jgi:hypothetical protein
MSWSFLVVTIFALTRTAHGQSASPGEQFDQQGEYAYAPDTGQSPAIKKAVDQGVKGMLPTPQRIAHQRLMQANKLPSVLRVIVLVDSVGTQQNSGKPMTLPRSGVTIKWDDGNGDVCRARETVVTDTLTQFCDAGSGGSAYHYVLEQDGQRLRRVVHITSPHLGGPVDYAIEFHRDSSHVAR